MSYECIHCGAELVYEDTWGVGAYWVRDNNPEGDIFRCPNHQGFEDEDSAFEYW
jgi:DNA-directed RNA polymerase subunit RPC12/RpoP